MMKHIFKLTGAGMLVAGTYACFTVNLGTGLVIQLMALGVIGLDWVFNDL